MFARRLLVSTLVVSALALTTCKEVPLTAPIGARMVVQANPDSIPAVGGQSTITVTAFKSEEDGGGTVADGTQFFLTTNLGSIEERVETRNGIARATLSSDGRSGTATITVDSGGLTEAEGAVVEIGSRDDLVITVVASPATLGPGDFTSEITATLTDGDSNLVPNVPVVFSTSSGTMASQGSVLRTNVSGQAFDRLTLLDNSTAATVTVTSGSATGSVMVGRAMFADPVVDFVTPSTGARGTSRIVTVGGQNFQPGATVSFGTGIGIETITFVNSETLQVEIRIDPGASTATSRDVRVTNPDGGSGTLAGGFTVT